MLDLTEKAQNKRPSLYYRFLVIVERFTKKKFLLRLLITIALTSIIFFPTYVGDLIGTWYNKLINSFIDSAIKT